MAKKKIILTINNHFDIMWRRPFEKSFEYKDRVFVSYADIEDYYIFDNIEFAREVPDYKFDIESVIVAKRFFERHPDYFDEIKDLIDQGRVTIPGSGVAIIDGNMIHGESFARNFLIGNYWLEDVFNILPDICVRTDAFGQHAQSPQILRQCEFDWVVGFCYSSPDAPYWQGIDGTTIYTQNLPLAAYGGTYIKYAPCPKCNGRKKMHGISCNYCKGRGIDMPKAELFRDDAVIDESVFDKNNCAIVRIGGEEILPVRKTLEWVEKNREKYDIVYGFIKDGREYFADSIAAVDRPDPSLITSTGDINPNNSGVLGTRIKTKLTLRRQEYSLLTAETLSVMAGVKRNGQPYPRQNINRIWEKMFHTMFHDAVTGTHVDAAYRELEEIWEKIDNETLKTAADALRWLRVPAKAGPQPGIDKIISVINPSGTPYTGYTDMILDSDIPCLDIQDENGKSAILDACSVGDDKIKVKLLIQDILPYQKKQYSIRKTQEAVTATHPGDSFKQPGEHLWNNPKAEVLDKKLDSLTSIENRRYKITADNKGILSIFDKKLQKVVSEAGQYRPGEFILEHDEGTPWATSSPDMTMKPLGFCTKFESKTIANSFQRLEFKALMPMEYDYAINSTHVQYSVTLYEGIDRVDFKCSVFWCTFNHRLRVVFPVPFAGNHTYEIPYGHITRAEYQPTFHWSGANGDWPSINWGAVEDSSAKVSLAVFNKGNPSYKLERVGNSTHIFVTLLRSPAVPTYLHECETYSMTEWDGMRDEGRHSFEYAFRTYDSLISESSIVRDAQNYNTLPCIVQGEVNLPEMPALECDNAYITSIKFAEKENALVCRIVEVSGKPADAYLLVPGYVKAVSKVNIMERKGVEVALEERKAKFTLRPFEIATVLLRF